jgi:hypothetical protein
MSFTEQGADNVSTIVKTCSRHTPVAVLSFRKPVVEYWSSCGRGVKRLSTIGLHVQDGVPRRADPRASQCAHWWTTMTMQ